MSFHNIIQIVFLKNIFYVTIDKLQVNTERNINMNTGLEKKAEKNIIASIEKMLTSSFLMLLYNSLTAKYHPALKEALREGDIKTTYNYLIDSIRNMGQNMGRGEDMKKTQLTEAITCKSLLLDAYDVIKIYLSTCSILDLCLEDSEDIPEDMTDIEEMKRLLKSKVRVFMDDAHKHNLEHQASAILFTILPN